ncbi:IS4 family transposase [Lusitaniella coriacea LEGE 07157]|uniref:IS4 family transposase n=3 Tax=Lusitaniella coriacea LEGE 07157 TaxID=945747 RepID=A0A8J7E0J3_9CYAN|nr:IS4 family transposase [Lusitaniella coriacea]MBE9119226.1 IS4 family transposase [Lusitaniella coriacea LEGE 07157]
MNQVNLLRQTLKPYLGWHGARLSFLSLFLIALFRAKTVNLAELATSFRSHAETESSYKRLQRFFRHFDLDYPQIAQVVVALMGIPQPWVLSVDRTEWSFGQIRFNILMLGVVHDGVAYPLVWQMLGKKGNSNTGERINLLSRFREIFPEAQVAYLSADREFVGSEWLNFLLCEPIFPFRIRIRQSDCLSDGQKSLSASVLFAHLKVGQQQVLSGRRCLWGHLVYVAGLRLEDGKLLVVVSDDAPATIIADYAQRWGIETLFGFFKTKGFCLESTHFVKQERLSKLVALLTLALCWAMKTGVWLHQRKPLKIKNHGRRAKSIFRYGFDHLRSIVNDLDLKHSEFLQALHFLSCT